MSIRREAFASIRWTAASMITRAGVAFLQLTILSRILSPADFGLQALAMTVITLMTTFADVGVSSAIIHYQDLDRPKLSSLYWLNLALGATLTVALACLSPAIAHFYRNEALTPLLLLLSSVFVIVASAQQIRVTAEKRLEFSTLAKVEIVSSLIGFGVALACALMGADVYALTFGYIVTVASFALLCWIFLSHGWRPMLCFRWKEIVKYVKFGSHLLGVNLANIFGQQADIIVAGRMFGAVSVGYYFQSRELSMRLMMIINPIVTRVGLPLIAKVQNDLAAVGRIYANTILMTASVNFPIYGFMAVFAPEIVLIVLGPKWMAAADLMRALAIWGAVRAIGNPIGSLLVGTGRSKQALKSSLTVTALVVATVVVCGRLFGILGIPYGLSALYAAIIVPFWWFNVRPASGLGFWAYHGQILRPAATTAVAVAAGWLTAYPLDGALLRLLAGGAAGGLAYLAASWLVNRGWLDSMIGLAPGLKRFRRPTA